MSKSPADTSEGDRVRMPLFGTGAAVVVGAVVDVVVDGVTLGGVVLSLEVADVAGGGAGMAPSLRVHAAVASTAVRAAAVAKAVRLGVVVELTTVSLREQSEWSRRPC